MGDELDPRPFAPPVSFIASFIRSFIRSFTRLSAIVALLCALLSAPARAQSNPVDEDAPSKTPTAAPNVAPPERPPPLELPYPPLKHDLSWGAWSISLSGGGSVLYSAAAEAPNHTGSTWSAGFGASASLYPHKPVVDDDTPYELQPFVQRIASVTLSASAGGSGVASAGSLLLGNLWSQFGGGGLRAAGYLPLRGSLSLYLGGGLGFGYSQMSSSTPLPSSALGLTPSLSLGLRAGDWLFSTGWGTSVSFSGGRTRPSSWSDFSKNWGVVSLGAHGVFRNRYEANLTASFSQTTESVAAWLVGYLNKSLGILGGLSYGHQASSTGALTDDDVGANLGVQWWASRRLAVSASYRIAYQWPGADSTTLRPSLGQSAVVGLSGRLP